VSCFFFCSNDPEPTERYTLSLHDALPIFIVSGGAITGGSFTVDMATIAAISTGRGDGEDRLSGHLKSADFFDVANFPTATFTIRSEEHTSELQSRENIVCRLLLEKKNYTQ